MKWSDHSENKLRELWNKGYTASQIAEMIGNTSRNAVIGKAHRLNLASRVTKKNPSSKLQIKKNNTTKPSKVMTRSRFKSLLLDKDFEPENPKALEELSDSTCRWPIGHPDEESFYFCGRNPIKGFPYCKLHVLYAFQPKNAKEEDQITEEDIPKFIEKKIKSA
jgi:GcrA cell cycle regulator